MEKMISELNGKLKALSFQTKKTDEVITKGDKEALRGTKPQSLISQKL